MNVVNELMQRAGVEQKELAAAVGVSQPTVSDWKRNKKDPKGENLDRVAEFFGVTPQVVKGLDPIPGAAPLLGDEDDLWVLREELRNDRDRRTLLHVAKYGSARIVRQAAALIDSLKATNPEFYDGDDVP